MRRLEYAGWAGYTTFAMGFTALASALPFLRFWLHAPYAMLSFVLLAWAGGNTAGYFGGNALVDRAGSPRVLRAGLLTFSAGYAVLVFFHVLTVWFVVLALVGGGVALIDVASARLVAHVHRPDPARALNRLNIFFGLGAILGALTTALSLRWFQSPVPVFVLLIALAVAGLLLLGAVAVLPGQATAVQRDRTATSVWRLPWVLRLGFATFLYIAAEAGFGTWISPFAFREAHVNAPVAALFPMVFWGGLMVTRILASLPRRSFNLSTILVAGSLAGAALSAVALAISHSLAMLLAAAFLAGCSYGPLFPWFLALASRRAPGREGGIYTVLYMAVALAALIVPWGEGQIFSPVPYLTLAITPVVSAVMGLVLWIDHRLEGTATSSVEQPG